MKKLLAVVLLTVVLTGTVGCSSEKEQTNDQPKAQSEVSGEQNVIEDVQPEIEEEKKFDIKEIVNKDGQAFIPDLSISGITEKAPLNSKEVKLSGKTYTMPIKISDLIADGWELSAGSFKNEFKPKTKTSLVSFAMKNSEGAFVDLIEAYNDTDSVQKLEDCLLTGFSISNLDSDSSKADFVFPGGIVKGSTAADVVSVYGDPNNSEFFTEYSYNLDKQLSYNVHKESKMSFSYVCNDDGLVRYAKVHVDVE